MLKDFLDPLEPKAKPQFPTTKTELANLAQAMEKLQELGRSLRSEIVIDVGKSSSWGSSGSVPKEGTTPTILSGRAAGNGYYIVSRQRKLRMNEYFRLFNIPPGRLGIPPGVSENQVRKMIGNSWCIKLVAAVLSRLLHTIGRLNSTPMPGDVQGGVVWC